MNSGNGPFYLRYAFNTHKVGINIFCKVSRSFHLQFYKIYIIAETRKTSYIIIHLPCPFFMPIINENAFSFIFSSLKFIGILKGMNVSSASLFSACVSVSVCFVGAFFFFYNTFRLSLRRINTKHKFGDSARQTENE